MNNHLYVTPNFMTSAQLRDAVAKGEPVTVFKPGSEVPTDGKVALRGPNFRAGARSWYANATLKDGKVVSIDPPQGEPGPQLATGYGYTFNDWGVAAPVA